MKFVLSFSRLFLSVSLSLFRFLSMKYMDTSSIICSLLTTVFFLAFSFSISYVKEKNSVLLHKI